MNSQTKRYKIRFNSIVDRGRIRSKLQCTHLDFLAEANTGINIQRTRTIVEPVIRGVVSENL
ncbi:MAG: hypothetical protein ABIO81_10525 [Ginsengibacter sp.]